MPQFIDDNILERYATVGMHDEICTQIKGTLRRFGHERRIQYPGE